MVPGNAKNDSQNSIILHSHPPNISLHLLLALCIIFILLFSEGGLEVGIRVLAFVQDLFAVVLLLNFLLPLLLKLRLLLHNPRLGRCHEVLVFPEGVAAHAAREELDGVEAEAGADFDQCQLVDVIVGGELLFLLVEYLVITEPDAVVEEVEGDHVVDERFAFRVILGRVKRMTQHLLHQLQVRTLWVVESAVKGDQGAAVAETVACELLLIQRHNILYQKLKRRPIRRLGQPHVQIRNLVVSLLEVNEVVAGAVKAQLINLLLDILSLDLGLLLAVRNQQREIINQVPEVTLNAALGY